MSLLSRNFRDSPELLRGRFPRSWAAEAGRHSMHFPRAGQMTAEDTAGVVLSEAKDSPNHCCFTQNSSRDPGFECGVPRSARMTHIECWRWTLSVGRFPSIFQHRYVAVPIVDLRHASHSHITPRCVTRRAKNSRSDQITRSQRRASLGALVLQLPGRIEERRLAQNGQRESAGEILFRVYLERWRGRPCDLAEIPNCRSTERHDPGRPRAAKGGQQNQAIRRDATLVDPYDLDLQRRRSPLRIELRRSTFPCASAISRRQQIGMVA